MQSPPPSKSWNSVRERLRTALSRSMLGHFRTLIREGAYINTRYQHGKTPLHLVLSWKKDLTVVKALLSARANPNAIDYYGNSPLHTAIQSNSSAAIIKALLKAGADIEMPDSHGRSPLMKSIYQHNTPIIRTLLTAGVDVKAEHLIEAVRVKCDLEVINLFITAGAPVNASSTAILPISYAVLNGDLEVVKLLLAAGANSDRVYLYGRTPLHMAIKDDLLDIVKTLINAGADVHQLVEGMGDNCLHLARSARMVKLLVLYAVDINGRNIRGATPLHALIGFFNCYNCSKENIELREGILAIKEMLQCGADVNATDEFNNTAIEIAVNVSYPKVVSCLINHGLIVCWDRMFQSLYPVLDPCSVEEYNIKLLIREYVIRNADEKNFFDSYPIGPDVSRSKKHLVMYAHKCKAEIELMKTKKVNCDQTIHHYVVENFTKVKALRFCSHYGMNGKLLKFMFPIYKNKVSRILNKCHDRAHLLDLLENIELRVPTTSGSRIVSLVNDCKCYIAKFLSNADLENFFLAMGLKVSEVVTCTCAHINNCDERSAAT